MIESKRGKKFKNPGKLAPEQTGVLIGKRSEARTTMGLKSTPVVAIFLRAMGCAAVALALGTTSASALTLLSSFNPSAAGGLCSADYSGATASVWVHDCSAADVQSYSTAGALQNTIVRPGESTNDVDIDVAPVGFTLGSTPITAGTLLFTNGETGTAEVYAVDPTSGTVITTLATAFGASHVVGGAYNPSTGTLFLVQDDNPAGTAVDNLIAEINPVTGAVVNTIVTTAFAGYSVNFGDVEVHTGTGNLFIVSNSQTSILEITPAGAFVAFHALPAGVTSLSGIGINELLGEAWVSGTGGLVWQLGGLTAVPVPPAVVLFGSTLALLGFVRRNPKF